MPGKWGGARRARPPLDPPMNPEVAENPKRRKQMKGNGKNIYQKFH